MWSDMHAKWCINLYKGTSLDNDNTQHNKKRNNSSIYEAFFIYSVGKKKKPKDIQKQSEAFGPPTAHLYLLFDLVFLLVEVSGSTFRDLVVLFILDLEAPLR